MPGHALTRFLAEAVAQSTGMTGSRPDQPNYSSYAIVLDSKKWLGLGRTGLAVAAHGLQ